jgi:hypothetical protein
MTRLLRTRNVAPGRGRKRAFLRGAASVMDLRGNTTRQYRLAQTGEQADADALADDWRTVGDDLRRAMAAHR